MAELDCDITKLDAEKTTLFNALGRTQALLTKLESGIKQISDEIAELRDSTAAQGLVNKPLPTCLDEDGKARLAANYVTMWNAKDWDGLYDMFSAIGKTFANREDLDAFSSLREDLCGELMSGVFVDYEFNGAEYGGDIFDLHYLGKLANGKVADINFLVRVVEGDWGMLGLNINCQQ